MLFKWANKKIKDFSWWHISLIKLSTAAFVLMVAKLWPPLLDCTWSTYLMITLIAAAPVCYKMFKK
ncbi:MAG: hypothetical protein JW812_00055 [Alphaproteobacteria bacterium]|nr:hypothetical protein [Alphaproteobacteria bacterium]MBN2779548.1 hypothetical protein [Alphaproteobacteria bacterium]